jgi:hypothetical protein
MTQLPERIIAMKCVSFDVSEIVSTLRSFLDPSDNQEITLKDVMEWIDDEDLNMLIGYEDAIFQDQDGGDIDY